MSNSNTPPRPATPTRTPTNESKYLPPARKRKGIVSVTPPLYNTPLRKIVYWLVFLLAAFSAVYTYRLIQWKSQAGGWVNLMLGRHPNDPLPKASDMGKSPTSSSGNAFSVEGLELKIRDLADELGIHPRELASAIKPLLPTASVSSIANANPTQSGTVVGVLAQDNPTDEQAKAATFGFGGLNSVVGMDEPVDLDD